MFSPDHIDSCLSCSAALCSHRTHTEEYAGIAQNFLMPLCDLCIDNPARMDVRDFMKAAYSSQLGEEERECLLLAVTLNKTERYLSLVGVVICILITEIGQDFIEVMLVHRKDKPADNSLSLVAGFMEKKHGSKEGSAQAEILEEANVTLDASGPIYAFDWSTNPANTLTLNCLLIYPEAILKIGAFEEDDEVSGREVFRMRRDELPQLCIPIHTAFLQRLHDEFFLAAKPPYVRW